MIKFISLILTFFVSLISFGQNNSLLYKIESPNSKPSYLFGTMHMVPDSIYYLPEKVQKILKHSDKLVVEVTAQNMQKSQQLVYMNEGSAFDIFTPEQKDSVLNWGASTLNVPKATFESTFSKLKPFNLLQVEFIPMMNGKVKFIEQELEKIAADIPKVGLETTEQQLAVFDSIPDNEMADMIMELFRNPGKSDQTMDELITAYHSRNIDQLSEVVKKQETSSETTDLLLNNRNARWIPKIKEFTKNQSCFIAVGAAHLGGEKGVIALLKKQGYTVTPIPY